MPRMSIIELRSDTFTLPSPAMISAIAAATLGDDGYGEDPTVITLERLASTIFRKDAACLMPSGTMANMAALKAHSSENRQYVLMGDESDLSVYERETDRTCLGMEYVSLSTKADGTVRRAELENALDAHGGRVAAVSIENPHNLCGGVVLPPPSLRKFPSSYIIMEPSSIWMAPAYSTPLLHQRSSHTSSPKLVTHFSFASPRAWRLQ